MTLKRKKPIKRTAVKKINPERRKREFARAYGSKERVEFVKALPCSFVGCNGRPSDNAHCITAGMGRKANADTIIPLCREHHRQFDALPARMRRGWLFFAHHVETKWQDAQ